MPEDLISLLERPDTTVAIVGATDNPAKFGNIIYKDLKRKGFRLFPINPHRKIVEHDQAYPSLTEIPQKPTIVDFVVPPAATLASLRNGNEIKPAIEAGFLFLFKARKQAQRRRGTERQVSCRSYKIHVPKAMSRLEIDECLAATGHHQPGSNGLPATKQLQLSNCLHYGENPFYCTK